MLSYLQKFHNLPAELQDKISSPETMQAIADIESRYGINLAAVVMKVMVKDISLVDLSKFLVFEYGLVGTDAQQIVTEMETKIFRSVADYLGIVVDKPPVLGQDEKLGRGLDKQQDATAVRSSTFFFSPEDEEEIKELTKKYTSSAAEITGYAELSDRIDRIAIAAGMNFSSADLSERFKKIIYTYLRGIRNKIDTKQTIVKPIAAGGLGFDMTIADKIINIADKPDLPSAVAPKVVANAEPASKLNTAVNRDLPYDFSKFNKPVSAKKDDPSVSTVETEPGQLQKVATITSAPSAALNRPAAIDLKTATSEKNDWQIADKDTHQPSELITNLKTAAPIMAQINQPISNITSPALDLASKRRLAARDDKNRMQDVKLTPRLTGPIEELEEMDLVNFRRLNQDPQIAAATIKEKIGWLEAENYSQKMTGIKGWRQSPLNKLYLVMGQDSINNKQSVIEIIRTRQEQGQDCLTIEEFNAVMDLNRSLRF